MGQKCSQLAGCGSDSFDKIRVKTPCGRREEVYNSCVAEKVMVKHPEHLVVHCSFNNDAVDITVIHPNERLEPGIPYMLYPKVESEVAPGAEKSNIPAKLCVSAKEGELKFRSSDSFKIKGMGGTGSSRSMSLSLSQRGGSTKRNIQRLLSTPGQELGR